MHIKQFGNNVSIDLSILILTFHYFRFLTFQFTTYKFTTLEMIVAMKYFFLMIISVTIYKKVNL